MAQSGIALIAGLGNPGSQYAASRHNVGFWFIERLQHLKGFRLAGEKRFKSEVGSIDINGRMVRIMVPNTFMNLSGQALAPLASFYRIQPEQILVIHDELDLAPGTARLKVSGGHGGHNGLRDIVSRLGSQDFVRLRLGIGHPGPNRDVSSYVLGRPDAHDRILIEKAVDSSLEVLDDVVVGNLDKAMTKLHTTAEPGTGESNPGIQDSGI
jgi:PTH1 family peptidyl-tRNA hydrolase